MPISPETRQRTIAVLTPHLGDAHRRALVNNAFVGSSLLGQIDFTGSQSAFAAYLVDRALAYGDIEPGLLALVHLLNTLRPSVGTNAQAEIDALKAAITAELRTTAPLPDAPPPEKPASSGSTVTFHGGNQGQGFTGDNHRASISNMPVWGWVVLALILLLVIAVLLVAFVPG